MLLACDGRTHRRPITVAVQQKNEDLRHYLLSPATVRSQTCSGTSLHLQRFKRQPAIYRVYRSITGGKSHLYAKVIIKISLLTFRKHLTSKHITSTREEQLRPQLAHPEPRRRRNELEGTGSRSHRPNLLGPAPSILRPSGKTPENPDKQCV